MLQLYHTTGVPLHTRYITAAYIPAWLPGFSNQTAATWRNSGYEQTDNTFSESLQTVDALTAKYRPAYFRVNDLSVVKGLCAEIAVHAECRCIPLKDLWLLFTLGYPLSQLPQQR